MKRFCLMLLGFALLTPALLARDHHRDHWRHRGHYARAYRNHEWKRHPRYEYRDTYRRHEFRGNGYRQGHWSGYRHQGLPPGLAKRDGHLPPGLQKHYERTGHLPPGLEKKIAYRGRY